MTPLWLDTLQHELDLIEELAEPNSRLQDGEQVIGTLENERLRRLYTLAQQYAKQFSLADTEAKYAPLEAQEAARYRAHDLNQKAHALSALLWVEVMVAVQGSVPANQSDGGNLGLRENWQVVLTVRPSLADFFGGGR